METQVLFSVIFAGALAPLVMLGVCSFETDIESRDRLARACSYIWFTVVFCIVGWLTYATALSNASIGEFAALQWLDWIGLNVILSVDGISAPLLLVVALVTPLAVFADRKIPQGGGPVYCANLIFLQTALIGAFTAQDLLVFYIFFELMLIPMFLLIGKFGGVKRIAAALKFVTYTALGSLPLLAAIIVLGFKHHTATGSWSFELSRIISNVAGALSPGEQVWLFAAFALAFAIKIPLFPLHSWLPDAYSEAPVGATIVMSALMSKVGLYGLLRFALPLFPVGSQIVGPYVAWLAVLGIIYGGVVAWSKDDFRQVIGFSSISHLGFCALGILAARQSSVTGAVFQMVVHAIGTAALFFIFEQISVRVNKNVNAVSGLATFSPRLATLAFLACLGSVGLPLTAGFVGEFAILTGSFSALPGPTIAALSGVVLSAVYLLTLYQRTMWGEPKEQQISILDFPRSETLWVSPYLALTFILGIFPLALLHMIEPSVSQVLADLTNPPATEHGEGGPFSEVDQDRDESVVSARLETSSLPSKIVLSGM